MYCGIQILYYNSKPKTLTLNFQFHFFFHAMNRQANPNSPKSTTTTKKRTRDLPNLTQCHACGHRIDACNNSNTGKNSNTNKKILTLYSEWRIVLLCIKCYSLVESSRICSYCFKESNNGSGNCFRCRKCCRSVHSKCFLEQKSVAPWSYSCCSSADFLVCIDCWVPESIANKQVAKNRNYRVLGGVKDAYSVEETKNRVKDHDVDAELAFGLYRGTVSLPGTLRDEPVSSMDTSVSEPLVAFRALDHESSPNVESMKLLGRVYVRQRLKHGSYRSKECDHDTKLAVKLHRAVDTLLPRNSKSLSMVNSSCLDLPKNGELRGSMEKYHLESSVSVGALDFDSSTKLDSFKLCTKVYSRRRQGCLKPGRKVYVRKRLKGFCWDKRDDKIAVIKQLVKQGEKNCSNKLINSSMDESNMNFGLISSNNQDEYIMSDREACDGKPDRYLLKYRKRE